MDSVRRQLAEDEAKAAGSPIAWTVHEDVSASQLITRGLELETEQCVDCDISLILSLIFTIYLCHRHRLAADFKRQTAHVTENQKTNWILRANNLRRKITSWIDIQHMYVPSLISHRQKIVDAMPEDHEETPVYAIPLLLPSSLPGNVQCDSRLLNIEFQLRYAQCTDALDELRDALCIRSYICIDKARFQRGQHANTRSQGIIDRVQMKVNISSTKYRTARLALVRLSCILGKLGWEQHILELKQEDIRPLNDEEIAREKNMKKKRKEGQTDGAGLSQEFDVEAAVSEGNRTVSWIWRQMGGEIEIDTGARLHESM